MYSYSFIRKTTMSNGDTIWVATTESSTTRKRSGVTELNVEDLSINVNLFLEQVGNVLEKTPENLGKFQLAEFEVHAEISAKGTLTLLGTGGEVGGSGGLKFKFQRLPASSK